MTLAPLWDASLAIQIHVLTVVPAAVLGLIQFLLPKGTPLHRAIGYAFMTLMVVTAIAAFFIPSFMGGRFSAIHLFIPLTLITVPRALLAARRGDIRAHKWSLIGLYFGAIGIAGFFAFMPGRVMHQIIFGG